MDINRNQYFLAGLVLLLIGFQFRMVDSFVLTPEATKVLAKQTGHPVAAAGDAVESVVGTEPRTPSMTIRPPEWVGWSFLCFGSVLILHSLAMKKPD
jgi:hypothetical protein